jgi:hypothetical protein
MSSKNKCLGQEYLIKGEKIELIDLTNDNNCINKKLTKRGAKPEDIKFTINKERNEITIYFKDKSVILKKLSKYSNSKLVV